MEQAARRLPRFVVLALVTALLPAYSVSASGSVPHDAKSYVLARPDAVSAEITARAQGYRVEILNEDTASTTTYANPNGTFTTESSSAPFRMLDTGGQWVPISTNFSLGASGASVVGENPLHLTLAPSASVDSPLVTIDPSGTLIEMKPLGLAEAAPTSSGPANSLANLAAAGAVLPPITSGVNRVPALIGTDLSDSLVMSGAALSSSGIGNEVVYPGVLGRSALTYQLGPSQLTESVIIPDVASAGNGDWRFEISAPGYSPHVDPSGVITFAGPLGATPIYIPQTFASDSSANQATTDVHTTLTPTLTPGVWTLDLWISPTWLHSSSRVFPINVDPSISVSRPPGWNYRYDGTTSSISYGSGALAGNPTSGSTDYWRSIPAFSTSGFTGTHIDNVTVTLNLNNGTTNCYNISAHAPSAGSYAGAGYGSALSTVGLCSGSATMSNTTALDTWVQNQDAGSAIELGLTGGEISSAVTLKGMYPVLNVTYDTPPTTPTIVGTASTTCSLATAPPATAYVNAKQSILCATSTDPDAGAQITFNINLETASGASVMSFTTSAVSSGTDVAAQIPTTSAYPNGLPDGGYKWQAQASNGISLSAWSGWDNFVVDTTPPTSGIACSSTSPVISQSGQTIDESQVPSGGVVLSCTFTGQDINFNAASGFTYQVNGGSPTTISASGTSSNDYATNFSYTIPSGTGGEGLTAISVYANDLALNTNAADAAVFTLDVGYGMSQPFANAAATATIPISAVAPSGTPSTTTAKVCWAPAQYPVPSNTCGTGWTNASGDVNVAATGLSWTSSSSGPVVTSPTGSGVITPIPSSGYTNPYDAPSLLLNVAAAGIAGPQVIDVEVCFITSSTTTCAPAEPVDVLAHGYGNAMATSALGPGSLSLSSGEYAITRTDATMRGYYDTTSLVASYSSMPRTTEDHSELGPDWTLNVPAGQGFGYYTITDSSSGGTLNGSVVLSAVSGSQFQFNVANPGSTPLLEPVGDALQSGLTATMSQSLAYNGSNLYCTLTLAVTSPSLAVTTWQSQYLTSNCNDSSVYAFHLLSVTEAQSNGSSVDTWFDNTSGQPVEVIASMPTSSNCGTTMFPIPITLSSAYQGCRVLSFQYATSTTATAAARTGTSGFGSYYNGTGNLSEVDLTQWDPNASSGAGAMVTMPVACYLYDAGGYLRETWDPRVGLNEGATPSCGSTPALPTTYVYTASAPNSSAPNTYPLASVAAAGQNAWSYSYDSSGRVSAVTRTLDASDTVGSTTATSTIAYGVPIAGGGSTGLPDLSSPSNWSQTVDVPVTGVAIFPADYVPSGSPGSSDWPHAAISYLDGYGRQVDLATYGDGAWTGSAVGAGWLISAQQYGQQLGSNTSNIFQSQSNVVWSLTGSGFELAQAAGSAASAGTAQEEATLNFYNTTTADGVPLGAEITDSYGPYHTIATSSSTLSGRRHTNYTYGLDTPATYGTYTGGASFSTNPFGQPWQLVTRTTQGYSTTQDPSALSTAAMASDFGSTSLPDYRTTTYYYTSPGSNYGSPLSFATPSSTTITVNGSTSITRDTYVNALGQVVLTTQPMSSGSDQGATITTYYQGTGSGACNGAPQWAGLVCATAPGATSPAVGSPVPTTTTTYNFLLEPQTLTKAVSGTTERTTNYAYDLAGRILATRVGDASGLGDTAVNDLVMVYSSTTGLPTASEYVSGDTISFGALTSTGTVVSSLQRAYDADGRPSSFTDASGATTTYSYTVDSLLAQSHEPVTGVTGGMSTCSTYGGTDALGHTELRPLVTSESVVVGSSCAGSNPVTYGAAYDANASPVTLVYPNAMVASTTYDPEGEATQLAYTQGGTGVSSGYGSTVMTFSQTYNAFGQVATASSPQSNQVYAYDGASRLIGVGDNFEGSCTTRVYSLDGDSNRTGYLSAVTSPTGGQCPTTAAGTSTDAMAFDTNGSGQGGSDRVISSTWGSNTGYYAYDALGRQTSIPSVDTGIGGSTSSGAIALTYRADDLVNSMSQGSTCLGYTYDPAGNVVTTSTLASTCTGSPTLTTTKYYAGSSAPAWTDNGNGTVTSYFVGVTQGNALNVTTGVTASPSCLGLATASCTLNLTDMRGNIVATASITSGAASVSGYSEQTEFGAPRSVATQNVVAPVYGWLGVYQKAESNLSGLVIMGVRVYNPTTGMFTASDPILGGNSGPYLYPVDSINGFDLSGMCFLDLCNVWSGIRHHWRGLVTSAEFTGMVGCMVVASLYCGVVIGVATAVTDSAVNAASDHWRLTSFEFVKQEGFSLFQSATLAVPAAFAEKGILASDPIWARTMVRFVTGFPSLVDQWATHR